MDFLMFAANPENTKFIPDEEFEVMFTEITFKSALPRKIQ